MWFLFVFLMVSLVLNFCNMCFVWLWVVFFLMMMVLFGMFSFVNRIVDFICVDGIGVW